MAIGPIDRRRFLAGTAGVTLAAAAGPLLSACSSSSTGGDSAAQAAANAGVALPAYVPYTGTKPDLDGSAKGVLAGYFGYPQQRVAGVPGKPAAGGKVTALVNLFTPVPPATGGNPYWQELNRRLGTTLALNMVPDASYLQKLATTLAGGDLPDLVQIRLDQPQRAPILKAEFADLTEYLSGDAVKKYPFLANIPTDSWRACVYNGGIYALPTPRPVVGSIMFCRDDLIRAKSLNHSPKDFQEFTDLCTGLTDAKNKQWALGFGAAGPLSTWAFVMQMLGAPNEWRAEGGKFVSWFETDEATKAVGDLRTLVKKGVFHPDSFAATSDPRVWFGTGKTALNRDGAAAWDILAGTYKVGVGALVAPKYDGGGDARHFAGGPTFALTALKKTGDKKRIDQLLSLANWLAAPLGTEERLFRDYGVEGQDFTFVDGVPTLNDHGKKYVALPLDYLVDGPPFLGPGDADRVRAQHDYQVRVVPGLVRSAAVGLYSDTDTTKKSQIQKLMQDVLGQIMQGNKPVSAWGEAVKNWRVQGGDKIRAEYEAAYADAH